MASKLFRADNNMSFFTPIFRLIELGQTFVVCLVMRLSYLDALCMRLDELFSVVRLEQKEQFWIAL